MTVRRFLGIDTEMFLRLCSRAPRTRRNSSDISRESYRGRPGRFKRSGCRIPGQGSVRVQGSRDGRTRKRTRHAEPGTRHVYLFTMRRLHSSRYPEPDDRAREGFDSLELEGDVILSTGDELPWLRPFGSAIPGPALAGTANDGPEETRILRHARELSAIGRRLDALLLLRRFLDDNPRAAPERILLAELLDAGGEQTEALDELTRALADAADAAPVLVHRGAILTRCGRAAEAEQDLRAAIRQCPGSAAAHFQLGLALLRLGRGAEAVNAFRTALAVTPDDAEATYYLGEALLATNDLAPALSAFGRAAVLAPHDPRCFKLMGRVLDRMGRTEEAMEMHRKAREAARR